MAPRFVEVATPIEDSVQWASSLGAGSALGSFGAVISDFVNETRHSSIAAAERAGNALVELEALPRIRAVAASLPRPSSFALYMLAAAATALCMRSLLVRLTARRILRAHGQCRAFVGKQD